MYIIIHPNFSGSNEPDFKAYFRFLPCEYFIETSDYLKLPLINYFEINQDNLGGRQRTMIRERNNILNLQYILEKLKNSKTTDTIIVQENSYKFIRN